LQYAIGTEKENSMQQRSGCPINLSMEVIGDKWSLIILRDIMFGQRRSFRGILTNSEEGIASNILTNRLNTLVEESMLTKSSDPSHSQKFIYSLTEKSIALVPVMVALGAWGNRFLPVSEELSIRAQLLEQGGTRLADDFMDELRHLHLGKSLDPNKKSVLAELQSAYEAVAGTKPDA
jgi:DNA-binding HxlR family transcriptional regulator